ncbi:MAG: prephenate dehydrogenase/arogenate dehydrogenase family protein [Candidatus Omnitrophota bacterium]|nr:prephenate dehydrogenase/arogenate dehydrogenase family protein [Candidatus Omnitrophota bacterium]
MKLFNKVAIIGVGLIGGSIGLAIKKRRIAREVIGVFRRTSTLKKALKKKAVDRATLSIKKGVEGADLIILASPVFSIPGLAADAVKYAKEGAIITDVGSTKGWIVGCVEEMMGAHKMVAFVGSHPMAGSEHAGVEFAEGDLLKSAPCIVTKTARTDGRALDKIKKFWKNLGADVKVMSPASHDKSVAFISHLPHIVAFSLAGAVPEKEMAYAAEGFKDTTRVASSDPNLWADIFLTNKNEIMPAAKVFEKHYKNIARALSRSDYAGIVRILKRAKSKRDKLRDP